MKELNKFRAFLNENKADVFDYADRIMGAGEPEDIDLVGLVDYYAENPDEIPEPMDAEIFVANADAIRDRVADYVAMMGEGKDEIDEGLFDKVIQKLKDKRAAKKEKERFTKGLDMKDFRGKGTPEIDPEFTAGLEEISLRGLMGRDMKGEDIAADPKKLEKLLGKVMAHIDDKSAADKVRQWLKMDVVEFPDTDYADPENLKLTAKAAMYYLNQDMDDDLPEMPQLNEGMYQEVDNMLSKTAVHMKADDFVDELIEELEAMKGAIPFLHKALKTIMANNNIPE